MGRSSVRSFRGRRVVARPTSGQLRLPGTVLARPMRPRSRWEPGIPVHPVPGRDPELEAEMAWWGFQLAEGRPDVDEATWQAPRA